MESEEVLNFSLPGALLWRACGATGGRLRSRPARGYGWQPEAVPVPATVPVSEPPRAVWPHGQEDPRGGAAPGCAHAA